MFQKNNNLKNRWELLFLVGHFLMKQLTQGIKPLCILFLACISLSGIINTMDNGIMPVGKPLTEGDYAFLKKHTQGMWWSTNTKRALLIDEKEGERKLFGKSVVKTYYIADLEKKCKYKIFGFAYDKSQDLMLHPEGHSVYVLKAHSNSPLNVTVRQYEPAGESEFKIITMLSIYEPRKIKIQLCCDSSGALFFLDAKKNQLLKTGDYQDAHEACVGRMPFTNTAGRRCYCTKLEKVDDAHKLAEIKARLKAKVAFSVQLQEPVSASVPDNQEPQQPEVNESDDNTQNKEKEQAPDITKQEEQSLSKICYPIIIGAATIGIIAGVGIVYKLWQVYKARKKAKTLVNKKYKKI